MRNLLLVAAVALSTTGCGIIYKQPIYQGNLIREQAVGQLQVGQSKQQVNALLEQKGKELGDTLTVTRFVRFGLGE